MDHDLQSEHPERPTILAVNAKRVAFTTQDGVSVRPLVSQSQSVRIPQGRNPTAPKQALALSHNLLNHLAVSCRDRTDIFDAEDGLPIQSIPGTGRAVTTLEWSRRNIDVLAIGTIDGSISIWTLRHPSRPLYLLPRLRIACNAIAFSPIDPNVLASAHGELLAIWSLRHRAGPLHTLSVGRTSLTGLAWHPIIPGRLLTCSADNTVNIWDLSEILVSSRFGGEDDSGDEGVFGKLDGLQKMIHPIANLRPGTLFQTAQWLGEHGMVVLAGNGHHVLFYSFGSDWEMLHDVWNLTIGIEAETVIVHQVHGSTVLHTVSKTRTQSHHIPDVVLDNMGGYTQPQSPSRFTLAQDFALKPEVAEDGLIIPHTRQQFRIWPTPIAALRKERRSVPKKPKRLRPHRRRDSSRSKQTAIPAPSDSITSPTSTSQAMTSSLELPKLRKNDNGSPMPFLSPNIPARALSPSSVTTIEGSLNLPPLPRDSFDSMPSTTGNDSDSDDETFTNGMGGSGTFMPGAINVPLPKSCSAVFGRNGLLVTFFPSKSHLQSLHQHGIEASERDKNHSMASTNGKLFPSFGNLVADDRVLEFEHGSESPGSESRLTNDFPTFALQPSSFRNERSWNANLSLTKPVFGPQEAPHHAIVTAYAIDSLLPYSRAIAEDFRVCCDQGESGSDLCRYNAKLADGAGFRETADVWRFVGLLLEDQVPLELMSAYKDEKEDMIAFARVALRGNSDIGQESRDCCSAYRGKLRWAEHPLGRAWAIRKIFDWAEHHADVQTLACVSSVLAEAEEILPARDATAQQSALKSLPAFGMAYAHPPERQKFAPPQARPIPILRTDSYPSDILSESPMQLRKFSQVSSRHASQPETPNFESSASPLPLSLPGIMRQNSKLSTSGSGSASPEYQRSSFSAAARNYAQSITDKFATYGTSPPLRKSGTSPGTNELSSSLPTGSWSKSVSFATISTTRESQLSKSYPDNEDDYDSEKTLDDASEPRTPGGLNTTIRVNLPNSDSFFDRISGRVQLPLLPEDLALKALAWRHYYAEQLRCWGLWMQAAELDKVTGLTGQYEIETADFKGVVPMQPSKQRQAICGVCSSIIKRVEQFCPACLHTTHLSCLEDYLGSLGVEPFECPTGCGCHCAELSADPIELSIAEEEQARATKSGRVRLRPSFTEIRW